MKKTIILSIFIFISLFSLKVQSQVTVTVGTGTIQAQYNPVRTFWGYNYTQQIYTATEISAAGAAPGMQINAIRFYWEGVGTIANTDIWTVFMGEVAQSNFTSTSNWVPFSSLTEVYTGNISLPASAGWFTITLTNPVIWNGSNIVVAIDENVSGYGPSETRWRGSSTPDNKSIYYYSDGTNPDPSSPPTASGTTTTRPNIQFEMTSLDPCVGEPEPGTASISDAVGCVGANFTLSSTDATIGAGITYHWQTSSDPDGPWTDIPAPNGTNLTCVTSTTTDAYYRLRIHCANSGLWGTSNVVSYSTEGDACLCGNYPAIYASSTADEDISNVTIGSWSNSSTCSTTAPGPGSIQNQYSNYVGEIAGPIVMQGETVNFSLTQTSCGSGSYNNGFQLYIDWNMDGDFQDAGEQVYNQPTASSGNHTKTGTFTVPMTATPGTTRMRVVVTETTFPTGTNYAHTAYSWGETEDYCITIVAAEDCDGMPTAGTAIPATQIIPSGGTASLNLSGNTVAAGLSYQWQRSTSQSGPFTNIVGANTQNYTTGALTSSYYYRCILTCVATGDAATSSVAFVDVVDAFNMSNTTITTCGSMFYDAGGPTGTYDPNSNITLTIMPEIPGTFVEVTFNSFAIENSYDKLYIYNGNSITAPLIGEYTGTNMPPAITSTASDGSLTFRFTSDGSGQHAGWEAMVTCYNPCTYEDPTFDQQGPFCAGWYIPDLPTTSNNGYEGTWSPEINNMETTTYNFTPNLGECSYPATMTIVIEPNDPASFDDYDSFCRGTTIPALPTTSIEGIEGSWSPAIDNWNTTEYTFVTDDGTCAWTTMEIQIDTVPAGITNNSESNELTCSLTHISLTATGGTSYAWNGGPFISLPTITVSDSATYSVIVKDDNGCTGEANIEITQNINPPNITFTNNTGTNELNCHIDEINLTASGGVSYAWSGGATPNSASNSFYVAGTYYVTVTGENDCDSIAYYEITEANPLDITENLNSPACFGMTGTAQLVVNSGGQAPYNIEWEDGRITFTHNSVPTNVPFGYTITDADNCSTARSLTITTPAQIQINFTGNDASCYGLNNASIDASSTEGGVQPYRYMWSIGRMTAEITNINAGEYFLTVTDDENCTASASYTVNQPDQIIIDMEIEDAICGLLGGVINTEVTGGAGTFTYEWSNGSNSNNISGLEPDTYTLTVTDANYCQEILSADINKTGDIIANITVVQPVLCGGIPDAILQAGSVNGAMPWTFKWSTGATSEIINNLSTGTYRLTVTDAWGCTGSTEKTLTAANEVLINSSVSHLKCNGSNDGKINISITSGEPPFNIQWSNGESDLSLNSLFPGNYSVTITDNRDCYLTETFEIIEPEPIDFSFVKKDVNCYGDLNGSIIMNATGGSEPYTYTLSTHKGQIVANTAIVNSLSIGNYIMKVVDNNECSKTDEVSIYQPTKLSAKASVTNPSCEGNNDGLILVTPFGGSSPYKYKYDNYDLDTNVYINLKEGKYHIEIEDINGCKFVLGKIFVSDGLLACLNIPNAFTPNGDGINETWIIENIQLYPEAQIFVYNRWGQEMYFGKYNSEPWNGTFNGKKLSAGAYFYIIDTKNDDVGEYKGTVSIVY